MKQAQGLPEEGGRRGQGRGQDSSSRRLKRPPSRLPQQHPAVRNGLCGRRVARLRRTWRFSRRAIRHVRATSGPAALPDRARRRQSCRRTAESSGRAQLADWILADDNPLPARVMANRIWQHHFGRGIVPTPNDFGKQGKPPTHPELLDYLAAQFRDGGWSIKSMHRLIMLVADVSAIEPTRSSEAISTRIRRTTGWPGFPVSRLDAESIRDTLLALGGNLDLSPAGPHPFPAAAHVGLHPAQSVQGGLREQSSQRLSDDAAHSAASVPGDLRWSRPVDQHAARMTSTTPLQALYLLNDPFVHEQSQLVAERILNAGSTTTMSACSSRTNCCSRAPADVRRIRCGVRSSWPTRDKLLQRRRRARRAGRTGSVARLRPHPVPTE